MQEERISLVALKVKGVKKTTFLTVLIFTVVLTSGIFILIPQGIIRSEFKQVVHYINADSRNHAELTYSQPILNNSVGWSFTEYLWHKNWLVDWNQVHLFLSDLEYYGEQAFWCDYYRIAPDDLDFHFLIWFQIAETEFVFLYLS